MMIYLVSSMSAKERTELFDVTVSKTLAGYFNKTVSKNNSKEAALSSNRDTFNVFVEIFLNPNQESWRIIQSIKGVKGK